MFTNAQLGSTTNAIHRLINLCLLIFLTGPIFSVSQPFPHKYLHHMVPCGVVIIKGIGYYFQFNFHEKSLNRAFIGPTLLI